MSKFKPGESGNPAGRPAGTSKSADLRKMLDSDLPEIISTVAEKAKNGDLAACKIILDRCVPILKPIELPTSIYQGLDAESDLFDWLDYTMMGLVSGDISITQASNMIASLRTESSIIDAELYRKEKEKNRQEFEQAFGDEITLSSQNKKKH